MILAKKAPSLHHEKALASWLFQTTRLTANNFIRSEMRRHHREQEAYMQSILTESGEDAWPRIAPLLDDAVGALGEKDRRAIILRFYEGRNLADVGAVLGASEDAAEKRVTRAVEKLRKFFFKRGVESSATALTGAISAHSVQVAPAALAKTISAVALAKGAAASASTLTLAKGALKVMAWSKTKTTIASVAIALLGIGTTAVVIDAWLPARGALTPLPNNISIQPPSPTVSSDAVAFSGAWLGSWGHQLPSALIVEKISSDGTASVIYSWGNSPWFKAGWDRETGSISNGNLVLADSIRISFALNPEGTLSGRYEAGDAPPVLVTMHRVPSTSPAEIRRAAADRINFQ
jgi:RNA polymerase sigma factor (sigma-70 family)